MRVEILGPVRVSDDDGRTVRIGGPRLSAVLTRLALDAPHTVPTAALSEAVWPEDGPADPAHALQALVSRLRGALPESAALCAVPGGYSLDLDPDAVDAHRFERLVAEGRQALEQRRADDAARLLREALDLWRGEPLADLPDATAVAARLGELRLTALEDRIAAELPARAAALIPELAELTAANPLRERLHALHIDALRAEGRGAEALAAYEQIRERLADRLGADPGPGLRAAHLAALRTEPTAQRGNLKAPLGDLIGREGDRARVLERLTEGRLVTLVGPGGVGKTRLASAVAAELDRPGGVWMVELAAVTDPDDVSAAAVAALGLRETARPRDPLTRLAEALGTGPAVLVLDNCEHLVAAAAELAANLLSRCPALTVLATGREPLGITGELLVRLLPLDVESAAALFTERAKAVRPDFEPTDDLSELCDRLDRLPLAIELAAARLRTMSLDAVAAKLDDRFALLRGGSRTALPRHQTLSAVVAWSWDLLDDKERAAAERLAVFAGGFSADAADYLDAPVDSLVDKSLIQFDGEHYRMLETIRDYALARAEDTRPARTAHAAYFLELAERAAPPLRGPDQLRWLEILTAERDNLNAAIEFACDSGDADTAIRLTAALGHFWAIHGEHSAAVARLLAALAVPGAAPPEARAAATTLCLFHALFAGEPDAALEADPPLRPADPIGKALWAMLKQAGSETGAEALGPEPEDPWKRGMYALVRALHHGNEGDMAEMHGELLSSAAGFREAGDRWGLASALSYASVATSAVGDYERGVEEAREAAEVAAELGSDDYQRTWLAIIRIGAGEIDRARTELRGIAATVAGLPAGLADAALAELARHHGDPAEAERRLDHLADIASSDTMLGAMLADGRGRLAVEAGDPQAARAHFARAFDLARGTGDMGMTASVAIGVAMLRIHEGEPAVAAELLGAVSPWELGTLGLDARRLSLELRETMGEGEFAAARERGRALGRDRALALIGTQTRR